MSAAIVKNRPPWFESLAALTKQPWQSIGDWPTPIDAPSRFAKRMNIPNLFIKREDRSHAICGGNKVRGLEFILGDALARRAKTILTFSAAGSHHIAKTAWHARQFGIDTIALVVPQPRARYVQRNMLAALASNARYIAANYFTVLPKLGIEFLRTRNAYYVSPGGTSPRSCLGHVAAALELGQQVRDGVMPRPDYLFVPMGSMGTAAGLLIGLRLARLPTRLVGVTVSYRWYCTPGRCARMARRILNLIHADQTNLPISAPNTRSLDVISDSLGSGYARFTPQAVELANQLLDDEGLALDGTYTSKTLHGMCEFIRTRRLEQKVHLFWNTYAPSPPLESVDEHLARLPPKLLSYFRESLQELDIG